MYADMCAILSDRQQGIAKVEHFKAEGFYALISGIANGEYVRLYVNNELMMSNTSMEKRTSASFVMNATGNVLICGLGIGLVIIPLLSNPEVKSITVIEKYQDVIDCVLPQLTPHDTENKLKVICADCFDWETKEKYDTIFIDIWAYINSDIYQEEMKPLKRKYRKYLSANGKEKKNIYVWAEHQARYNQRLY